jgi:ABC-type enterochelin transport system substrate-binding protein
MKKIFIFVAAVMMTALVGCGQKTASSENADSTAVDTTAIDSIEVVDSVDTVEVADSAICNE